MACFIWESMEHAGQNHGEDVGGEGLGYFGQTYETYETRFIIDAHGVMPTTRRHNIAA